MNSEKLEVKRSERSFPAFFRNVQKKISSSPASYLFYCFLVPAVIMYLIYLAMEIHPFGDGTVLVLDLNGQYVYFFEALRNCVRGDGSLLYSFFRALGGEFVGIYAYYLASPLSYLVALFPAERIQEALLVIILLKTGLCGYTFGFYLHKHTTHPNKVMTVAFAAMYALCSYAVVHQNNLMWIDALIWLPILVWSIEELIKKRHYKMFVISLSMTMLSNYYIGYMVCIFSLVYFFYYYFSQDPKVLNPHGKRTHLFRAFVRFALFALLSAAIAAFIIFGAYYSLTFGKSTFSDPNWSFRVKFDFLDFFTKFLPGAYDTVRPEGLPFVYCGLLTLLMLPVYFTSRSVSTREKLASLFLIGFFFLSFLASPLDLIWHGFQNPNWLNYRYSFMLCFMLLVMAYRGFGNLRQVTDKFLLGISAFIVLFVVVAQKETYKTYLVSSEKLKTLETVWLTILVTVVLLALLCIRMRMKNPVKRENLTGILAAVICLEIFCNSLACVVQFDEDVSYSRYSSYNNFVQGLRPVVNRVHEEDSGFYRMEKTMHRKSNDNMALKIRGLSNSTSTLNAETIAFLNTLGYTARSHLSSYRGGTPVSDSLLGLRYLIDYKDSETFDGLYEERFTEGNYTAYYNPYALSLAYGVDGSIRNYNAADYQTFFERMNALTGTMLGEKSVPLFLPIYDYQSSHANCSVSSSVFQNTYTPATDGSTSCFTYTIYADADGEYYFYTPVRSAKPTTLAVNGDTRGEYLGGDTNHIISLGYFEEGDEIAVTITLKEDAISVLNGYAYFWRLDMTAFEDAFSRLKANPQFVIDEDFSDDDLTGSITTTTADQTILTTIPYDKGWKVLVDGQEVETYETLNALVAFDIEDAGEHTLELKYRPRIYTVGAVLSVTGVSLFVLICLADWLLRKFLRRKEEEITFPMWTLEDFDEDAEGLLHAPTEEKKPNEFTKRMKLFFDRILRKKNVPNEPQSPDDASGEKTENPPSGEPEEPVQGENTPDVPDDSQEENHTDDNSGGN